MDQLLGLFLLAAYIVAVIGLAALITWGVIKVFPTERTPKKPKEPQAPSGDGTGETGAGSLFRRAKRGTT